MLEGKTYCPLLHTRVAEMKALQMLSSATKDLLFPLFVMRPWPNAKRIEKTWDKISECFGPRRHAIDLDPFKRGAVRAGAGPEFDALFDPSNGFENFYRAVEDREFAIPVLQSADGALDDLDRQSGHVDRIGRGAVLRLQQGITRLPNEAFAIASGRLPDLVIWIDLGWTRDLLQRELWASQILEEIGRQSPDSEVVLSGSSFPASFGPVEREAVRTLERQVYENLVRRHNAVRIRYGDWASTRAPQDPTPMKIVKRLDLPVSRDWVFFKDGGDESYRDLAERVRTDPAWLETPEVWGAYLIESTAEDLPGSIKGQAAAAAARVNIHMHRQAHFDNPLAPPRGDEPFTDDF